ncbi:MAG: hypothetical protein IH939_17275 [Acidobacteria bacterium]|nr:hypothetical protein [Acidobacteriota bacterium]
MTWKASLAGLPFGGGKGGIRVDPEQLSRRELRRLTEAYVQAFCEAIGPDTDIMAPDLNTNDALLCLGVDILIPAAIGGVITAGNADRVRARVIVEGANGPVSGMADVCLQQRGIRVVPDVLANCGGVVGSYIEWRQNRRDTEWSDDQVLRMFLECLHNTYSRVHQTMTERSVPMRLACYMNAVGRVLDRWSSERTPVAPILEGALSANA